VILSPNSMLLFSVGFLVLGILLAVSYWSKLIENKHGVTSEMSGLLTFFPIPCETSLQFCRPN